MKRSMIEVRISLATVLAITLLSADAAAQKNTKFGEGALASPSSPDLFDSAFGYRALNSPTTGGFNTAIGTEALKSDTTGNANTALGWDALFKNTTGRLDTATGSLALDANTTGEENTAVGFCALCDNTTGSNNIGLGINAGYNLTTGSNNIDIGNRGVGGESDTIRIGTQGRQTSTFVGGIFGSMVTGDTVVVSSGGQLGMVMSSARYKRDIRDMGSSSAALMKLRPVTFRYRGDASQQRQYGLVAEEVARVYPDLVSNDANGDVVSVHYHELIPMLLNEIQRLNAQVAKDQGEIHRLSAAAAQDQARRASFEQRLSVMEHSLAARDQSQTLTAALDK